jgi:hypothetical protein
MLKTFVTGAPGNPTHWYLFNNEKFINPFDPAKPGFTVS